MKKSLNNALNSAIEMSIEHPEIVYAVMDKKRKRSCVHSYLCDWFVREKILDGWTLAAQVKNGKVIFKNVNLF